MQLTWPWGNGGGACAGSSPGATSSGSRVVKSASPVWPELKLTVPSPEGSIATSAQPGVAAAKSPCAASTVGLADLAEVPETICTCLSSFRYCRSASCPEANTYAP